MSNVKSDRFTRVASLRIQKVLDSMENLSKCSNRGNYEYSAAEVKKMLAAIKTQVRNLENMFGDGGAAKKEKFRF